ncbi:MAG: hypothetical protein DA408_16470 [Bacteroidetes bacterium]|nr:MAG: hypothetical protein DA408_16470 [Bacteroidota bacterium]
MSKAVCQVFGIRHHGPGSARRLVQALDNWQPDCILIEFPADAQGELQQVARLALEPPVALVIYAPDNIQQAFYYPFARFSPEWQALQWAARHRVPVQAMDLPAGIQLALRNQQQLRTDQRPNHTLQQDPLGEIARLAGYDDREQWWELTFEQETDDLALFAAINELIQALRTESDNSRETLLREAWMRQQLRKTLRSSYQRIAIVCGAWHSPALLEVARFKASSDQQVLKGLPKTKVNAAWIPWSYPSLARESGYGAGVHSPAWYEALYDHGAGAVIYWMVRAAQLLRDEGMDVSPAHAQEGVRLARTLAAMREQRIPKLDDLRAAALSTLCGGSEERLALIAQRLLLGEKVGTVPENASVVPLQKDLTQLLKTTRLNKYWGLTGEQWLKANKTNPQGGIDLREANDLLKSQLLHQLLILAIPWGRRQEASANDLGAFKELWCLKWQPLFSLSVVEAAMWGNTVREAAANKLRQPTTDANVLTLAQAVLLGLRADLPAAVQAVIQQLRDRSALTRDVQELLAGLPALIKIIQYGDARKTDVTALALLVDEITPRLAAGLPGAATALDEEAAQLFLRDLLATHRGLCQLNLPLLDLHWWPALQKLSTLPSTVPLVQGLATRLLFDRERLDLETTSRRLDYALSRGNEPLEVANWIAGFLHGSGLLLLHHPALWRLVDDWIAALDMDEVQAVLPLLRRTFSQFSPRERQQMLHLVQHPPAPATPTTVAPAAHYRQDALAELLVGVKAWTG